MSSTDSKGGTRYCIAVPIELMLKKGPEALAELLIGADGKPMTGPEVYAKCWQAWLAGYEVLPVCSNHDPKGHCLGHVKGKDGENG